MSSVPPVRPKGRRGGRPVVMPEPLEARQLLALTTVFSENFDNLAFGPNQEEATPGDNVWTNVPPAGWVKDDTGVPGYNNGPENNGVKEWIGWTFAQKDWWVTAAGDQDRGQWTSASGGVMIADDDEWDDAPHPGKDELPQDQRFPEDMLYNALITSPAINIAGAAPGSVTVDFDSAWKPEGLDDGLRVNNQTAIVEAVYSNGTTQEIMHWDSDPFGEFYHGNATDEHVSIPLEPPAGATSVKLRFELLKAANDWWWSVDNVQVTADVEAAPAPTVTNVYVSGSNWADSFKSYLAAQGQGSAQYGYSIPATDQLNELPWTNINQVSVTFDSNVQVAQDDLAVRGVTVPTYAVQSFNYDPNTKTATWTLAQAIQNDKVIIDVDGDAGGVSTGVSLLDGEWNNAGDTFPSGNGTAGGDFRFRVNILPGDVNRDGRVNAVDLSNVRARQLTSTTNAGTAPNTYNAFSDVNGSGNINAVDLGGVRSNQLKALPGPDPTSLVSLTRLTGVTKDLFALQPILPV